MDYVRNTELRDIIQFKKFDSYCVKMLGLSIDSIIDGHHRWTLMAELLKITELSRVRSRATELEPELKFFFEKRRNQQLIPVIDITDAMEPVISYEPYPVVWFRNYR
jgi:hypothetical protein